MSNPWDDEVVPEGDTNTASATTEVTPSPSLIASSPQVESVSGEVQWYGQGAQEPSPALYLRSTDAVVSAPSPPRIPSAVKALAPITAAPKKSPSLASTSSSTSANVACEKASACSEKFRNHGYRSALTGFLSAIARVFIVPSILLRQLIFSSVDKQSLQKSETTSKLYMASVGFVLIDIAPLAILVGLLCVASSLAFMLYISPLVYFTHALALCMLSLISIPFIYRSIPSSIKSSEHNGDKKKDIKDGSKNGSSKRSSRTGSSGTDGRRVTLFVVIALFLTPLAVVTVDVLIGLIASHYLYEQSIILSASFALVSRCLVQIPIILFAISVGYALQYHYMLVALHQDAILSNNTALISELCSRGSERRLKFGGGDDASSKVARYICALWLGDDSIVPTVPKKKNEYGAIKTIQTLMSSKPEHLDRKLSRFVAIFIINPIAWIDCSNHIVARFVRLMSESDLVIFAYQKILKERHLMFAFLESPAVPLYSPELHCNSSLRIEALKKSHHNIKTE